MYCPVGSSDLDSLDLNFLTLFLAWAALALTHTILRMIKTNYFYDHYRSRNPQLVETTVSKPQAGSKLQRLWLLGCVEELGHTTQEYGDVIAPGVDLTSEKQ